MTASPVRDDALVAALLDTSRRLLGLALGGATLGAVAAMPMVATLLAS